MIGLKALVALLGAMAVAACAPSPSLRDPSFIGTWEGEPPGPWEAVPEIVTLTLYGAPHADSGHYQISTTVRAGDFGNDGGLTVWSGTWTRRTGLDNGQPRSLIHLNDALASNIDQYAIGPDLTLEPTSEYLHRSLTRQEIALYSLHPLTGSGARLVD